LPRATIIIPHLNTPEYLVQALQAVSAQALDSGGFEVIVVDNGSRLPLDAVARAWPAVRFLLQPTPGPGPARNLGAAYARAPVLAFVDADVEVLPGWLQAGLDALAADGRGPIGGDVRIRTADGRRLTGVEAFESVFSFRQQSYIARKHYSVTANLMMTAEVFARIGPFGGIDQPEDMEFGQRGYSMGLPTRYVPEMRALHPARRDFDDMRRKWHRLSVQALSVHLAAGRPMWKWDARALAVMASPLVHTPRMLGSRRISGVANRLRGLAFLYAIRWARGQDMLRISRARQIGAPVTAAGWNA
jgi:glycosyltransferase involved in cell wall biosynthesis